MVLDQEFPPDIRVENEIEALTGAGIEVHLASLSLKERPRLERQNHLVIHRMAVSPFVHKFSIAALTCPLYFHLWSKFLADILKKEQMDVLHIHDLPLISVGIKLGRKFGIPVLADLHENWPALLSISSHTNTLAGKILSPVRLWTDYEKMVLGKVDRIITVVEEARNRILRLNIDESKVQVVSNTLNLNHFQVLHEKPHRDDILLVYTGGITYHRGLQTVIQAMGRISKEVQRLKLWIIGEGRYTHTLKAMCHSLGLDDKVIFHGYQPYQEMIRLLGQADYGIIPHIRSGHTDATIPHKLFQYMYAGMPVISSDCLPLVRVINEAQCGFIYTSDRAEELAQVLKGLDKKADQRLGNNGREMVLKKYTWDNDARELLRVYQHFIR